MNTGNIVVRRAREDDLPAIGAIYNEAIAEGGFTADLSPLPLNEKVAWFRKVNQEEYGVYALINDVEVIGFFYFSPWRGGRDALRSVAELSFYLRRDFRGKGYGNLILSRAIKLAEEKSFRHLLAILLDVNHRSKRLLEKFGFSVAGQLPDIADLGGRRCGQYIMLCNVIG